MTYRSSFAVQLATSLPTTRFACRVVISQFAKTVSSTSVTKQPLLMLTSTSGQASLPVACPVCLHEPIMPDDCRPNKALRTTIKVFLKKKVMERETARKKEAMEKALVTPATPATPLPDQTPAPQPSETPVPPPISALADSSDTKQGSRDMSQLPQARDDGGSRTEESAIPTEAQKDIPQESIEVKPLVHMRKRSSLTFFSHLVVRYLDEHLPKPLVTVVLVRKRQMITKSKWNSSSSLWVRMSSGHKTICRG